ncbi:MAG TPA: glucoamylase family protein, partial [Gemmatimonadales bacterium]|nr:glucoamylase family protein [Gemmatimonadales bacterium]
LALASPTHPADSGAWSKWVSGYQWGTYHGQSFVQFAPLFGHEYSHVWIDFQGVADAYMSGHGIDYFENSRRATLSQRAYAIANPGAWAGYTGNVWGLTACDGPADKTLTLAGRSRQFHTYWARGAGLGDERDDGTICPTAVGGAVPFAPEYTIPALLAMRSTYGNKLFTTYGFLDAFNPTFTAAGQQAVGSVDPVLGWFDVDYLGIDQGPILAMVENYRTGLVWRVMRTNSHIIRGLQRAGFTGGWLP